MEGDLNRVLHQPIRTRIMAFLVANGSCDYTTLKNQFNLTDGHMTTHMRELLENEYVAMEKSFVHNKPRTTYSITQQGKKAFEDYIDTLKKIIMFND